jgi:hypothetical protein
MSGDRYLCSARLVPFHKPIVLVDRDEGVLREQFSPFAFAGARQEPGRVRVLVDHADDLELARMSVLVNHRDWLIGDFILDEHVAEHVRPGTPVSIGFDPIETTVTPSGTRLRECVLLRDVSIVREGAIPGAEIISVMKLNPVPPPAPRRPPRTAPRTRYVSATDSGWPPGTRIRRLPDGSEEITHPVGAARIVRPCGQVLAVR